MPAEQGITIVVAILHSAVRVDTANGYSDGESERRIAEGVRRAGGLPAGHWISTKIDGRTGNNRATEPAAASRRVPGASSRRRLLR